VYQVQPPRPVCGGARRRRRRSTYGSTLYVATSPRCARG
jgi:hypothetical protein